MNLQPPMALRPLVLLTLAVLAAHLLLLGQAPLREPGRPPGMRSLVTRVLADPAPSPAVAPPNITVDQRSAEAPRPPARPSRREALARLETPAVAATAVPAAARTTATAITPDETPIAASRVAGVASSTGPASLQVAAASAHRLTDPAATGATPALAASVTAVPAGGDAVPTAFAIPGSVRLRYAVNGQSRGQGWTVTGQLQWRHDGSQYEAMLEYSAPLLPSRSQRSSGLITAAGLAPLRFSDRSRSEQATHFDRTGGQLVFSNNAPQQPLLPGMQDRLSVFLQLAAMLAAAPERFPEGSGVVLQTAGTRDAQPWLFIVQGDETLRLPGGSVQTRKLAREPRGEYDTRVELWLATGMDYIPVRIRLTQPNGDYVDQQWASTDRL